MNKKLLFFFLFFGFSCSENDEDNAPKDTPTSGKITILSDSAYQPIIQSAVEVFTTKYPESNISVKYLNEYDAWSQFVNDSAKLLITSRKPNEKEIEYFNQLKFDPTVRPLAYDALAFLLHPSVKDTCLTYDEIRQIITGEITDWKNIASGTKSGKIQLVMDNAKGSSARTLKEQFLGKKNFPSSITATQDFQKVIDWVAEHPNSLGVIPVSWVCDSNDPKLLSFFSKIKVAEIAATEVSRDRGEGYQPFQAYLAQKKYSFTREIFAVGRYFHSGLASNFSSFLAGPKGQLIFLKSGLLPATQPIRIQSIKQ